MTASGPRVGVLMGSKSDWETMSKTSEVLASLGVAHECHVMSAHRTPDLVHDYVKNAESRGIQVIVAAAGGAAHLAGVCAAYTTLPVLAVPIHTKSLGGLDSLLSMVQMPKGVPVGCLAIGDAGASNAGFLAGQILALTDPAVRAKLREAREKDAARIRAEKLPS